ncbi:C39 family peptidase [Actinokineospora spheciospongiae]|uniref:C39 family peptidase n=1 Tax=Actinokineospora spheciospongiae TaxID=909613 RepID=UPI000D710596|nr:C39 family peptidase [Actinokineospora spheciospongiae]PWW65674.1 peptidase C39-like protein [Actinokineospora spheciospongiae]
MRPLRLLTAGVAVLAAAAVATPPASATTTHRPDGAPVDHHRWTFPRDFAGGRSDGLLPGPGGLRIGRPAGSVEHTEPELGTTRRYDYSTWTSPVHRPGFDATQLVASWNATTPAGTWLRVELRGDGPTWFTLGRWALGDQDIIRSSVPDQSDDTGYVDVDTFVAAPGRPLRAYQLRVTLFRATGTQATPTLRTAGAMTSAIPDRFTVAASTPSLGRAVELAVPAYSQNVHIGQYPQYGGGGEAWCSPTSTQMVVEYWGKRPSADDLAWVDPTYADRSVDHAARATYDHDYDGTGNWPFNTAYAASYGLSAHVTRLRSLTELEAHIARGIPVVTSQSFRADELDGAGYGTAGHLMVVVGFTAEGDVIANDPASPDNAAVRHVYKRAQFENIWLRTKRYTASGAVAGGSGGIAYIITR